MDFTSALEKSLACKSKVAAMERSLALRPDDRGIRITLLSARRVAERSEQTLISLASEFDIDICRYRVVRSFDAEYPAMDLAHSLVSYQELFTSIYDYVKNGPKAVKSYSREIRDLSLLNLGYTFPGSLGVLLTVGNQRDLFDEGELDKVIGAFGRLSTIDSIGDVKGLAGDMGLNVVRRLAEWSEANWKAEYSVDLQWTQSNAHIKGGYIPRERFQTILSLIKQTSDEEPKEIEIVGTLSTYSILRDSFALVTSDEKVFAGGFAEGFIRREYKIPKQYRAKILSKEIVKYATDTSETTYHLMSLTDIDE